MDQIEQAYRVLELELGTSMTEVNQAYKDLVFIWHPDRIPSDRQRLREKAETKLKQLNEARSFLRSQVRNGKIPARSSTS
ncbi:MAG: J domain-containing protein [Phormidesmis sp.]